MVKTVQGANLVLRFLLELAGLIAAGYWGFTWFDHWVLSALFGIGIPVLMAAAWGIFRVPNDGGPPVVEVKGQVRLCLEIVYFGQAVYLLAIAGKPALAAAFATILVINYAIGYRRTLDLAMGRPLRGHLWGYEASE